MNFKRFVVAVLALCLTLALCACGGAEDNTGNAATNGTAGNAGNTTTAPVSGNAGTEVTDDKVEYTVKVVDFDGNPVAGVKVQLCVGELCKTPATTNEQGVVTFKFQEDVYEVKVSDVPANMQAPVVPSKLGLGDRETTIKLERRVLNYAVMVTDEGGNAVTGVTVQFQNENLSEVKTDAEGKAAINGFQIISGVVLTEIPDGYTADVTEHAFGEDSYNAEENVYKITVVLKAVA